MNWDKIAHFTADEFRCRCGCGLADMDEAFMVKLDQVRDYLCFPITISSGYRCPEHNNVVSGTGFTGPHTTGKAADLLLSYGQARTALTTLCLRFSGIGIQQKGPAKGRFIHVDTLADRVWTY